MFRNLRLRDKKETQLKIDESRIEMQDILKERFKKNFESSKISYYDWLKERNMDGILYPLPNLTPDGNK